MKKIKDIYLKHPFIFTALLCISISALIEFTVGHNQFSNILLAISFIIPFFYLLIVMPFLFFKDKRNFSKKNWILIGWILLVLFLGYPVFIAWMMLKHDTVDSKRYATKTIHAQTVKYISAEAMGCTLGETTMMNGNLTCSELNATNVIDAAAKTLTADRNPYDIKNNAVRISTSNTLKKDIGYINLSVAGSNVIVKSCHKKPCSDENNRLSKTISIEIK